ncbi:thiamine pyrophosphate-binding protein [Puniceibacterium sp. IMCC21224]|uniref:thiamine pyrophosphate-binding protein n=1 Tax=Puniceibacterium sp. IMCC21224 TaxID=1618204 RepID=UPI00064DA704|nr:thiamine pyrophosphate-binding protein [Puniceibacterium sp. IMCC21224]KMK65009.1 thiamine pyrophosphate-dependent enzyme, possible carboligase or decarboxylase [Puniceibacterium sp. IMCC21224]
MADGSKTTYQKYQSDVIVDLLQAYDFEYIAINPGASFRGLHDSLVNYGEDKPKMLVCQHEETAVQIAHGYAKALGKPMACILHDLVGLLHGQMAVYYAFTDRAPVFILGATGPMDESKRRPRSDWHHTAQSQGDAVRNFTKFDYQPHDIEGVPDSFMRAYSTMVTEPAGPTYLCYDAMLQEKPLTKTLPPINPAMMKAPAPMAADETVITEIVDKLLAADFPYIMAEFTGRHPGNFDKLVTLAETLGVAVWDVNSALCFPNKHPLSLSMDTASLGQADAILALDVTDWEKAVAKLDSTNRKLSSYLREDCLWMDVGFHETGIGSWSLDYGRYLPKTLSALGDPRLVMPQMTRIAQARIDADPALAARIAERKARIGAISAANFARWKEEAKIERDASPLTTARLAEEVYEVIKDEDWVLAAGTLRQWTRKLWDFDKEHRHPGKALGTSTQIGMGLGVALAHKNSDKVVVTFQPDGDLMYDAGALWTAAKHEIPLLIVMFNNRAYYNDWHHQIRMARMRGTDEGKAHIGMDIFDPEPDFATIAKGMGVWAEGPIEDPAEVGPAVARALEIVKSGKPALVDVITRHR